MAGRNAPPTGRKAMRQRAGCGHSEASNRTSTAVLAGALLMAACWPVPQSELGNRELSKLELGPGLGD